jgi:hypothetical protein
LGEGLAPCAPSGPETLHSAGRRRRPRCIDTFGEAATIRGRYPVCDPQEARLGSAHSPLDHLPGTPRELEAIILRLLSKSPGDRYPGAEELLIELRAFLNRAA